MRAPIVMAFLLADKVFREMETGKVHIAGTFNQLSSLRFPMLHPQFYIYLCMNDLDEGDHKLKLEFRYLETGLRVMDIEQPVKSRGPLDAIEVNMCFNNIRFEQEGSVEISLELDGQAVANRSLRIRKIVQPGANAEEPS
jgi:hypothetical protein